MTLTLAGGAPILWALIVVRRPPVPIAGSAQPLAFLVLLPFALAGVADPGLTRVLSFEGIDRVGPTISAALLAAVVAIVAGAALVQVA